MQLSKTIKICLMLCCYSLVFSPPAISETEWSASELDLLRLQWIESLPKLLPDPTNVFADNPAVAKLGHKLFFDQRFSINNKVSCATCHQPDKQFTDGLAKARGIGETSRSTPGLIGIAYSPWFFWDGRSDSLWSQALGPLESKVEHGGNRSRYAHIIFSDPSYRKSYEALFGFLPELSDLKRFPKNASPQGDPVSIGLWQQMSALDQKKITRILVNIGKAIAAYERLLKPGRSRFDRYVEVLLSDVPATENPGIFLTEKEVSGLKLFLGKAVCVTCHQGPLFTNQGFHNIGTPDPAAKKPEYMLPLVYLFKDKPMLDTGRYDGIRLALESEFSCLSEFSDARQQDCVELRFANKKHTQTLGAFKVPTLRNISRTGPYMHAGQFSNLADVLKHYNNAPKAAIGHSELTPLNLTEKELRQIEAFLHSLNYLPSDVNSGLLHTPEY